jgi:hypothetical protein
MDASRAGGPAPRGGLQLSKNLPGMFLHGELALATEGMAQGMKPGRGAHRDDAHDRIPTRSCQSPSTRLHAPSMKWNGIPESGIVRSSAGTFRRLRGVFRDAPGPVDMRCGTLHVPVEGSMEAAERSAAATEGSRASVERSRDGRQRSWEAWKIPRSPRSVPGRPPGVPRRWRSVPGALPDVPERPASAPRRPSSLPRGRSSSPRRRRKPPGSCGFSMHQIAKTILTEIVFVCQAMHIES